MQDSVQLEKKAVEVALVDLSIHGVGLLITEMDDETRRVVRDFAFSGELRRTSRTPLP